MTRLFTFLVCLLISCTVFAGPSADHGRGVAKTGESLFDAWAEKETTSIKLYLDMDSLEVYRRKIEFLPAKVIANGQALDLEVAVRGRFRRRNCAMPPLKLKFAKEGLRAHGLNTHNDFKLVTHCTDDAAGREALLREQLAYELYQTVNPSASFRTQLLEVTYINIVDGSESKSIAILIEDSDELKDRLEMNNCKECYGQAAATFTNAEEVTLFQYMIGNTDFCHRTIRNMKILEDEDGNRTSVPYDFDFSGIVNASYASPQMSHLGQKAVTDRVLNWTFNCELDLTDATAKFKSLKDTFLAQVENFDGLEKSSKREISKYLKDFYKDLEKGDIKAAK